MPRKYLYFQPSPNKVLQGHSETDLGVCCPSVGPPPKHLQDKLDMVLRRSAHCICGDFSPTSSASALVKKLNLDPLQLRHSSNKVTTLYKLAGGLPDAKPREETLTSTHNTTCGHKSRNSQLVS